jgi:DcuC family C4-dicarboxylate transporter
MKLLALVVLILTFIAILRHYEVRLTLLFSGFILALMSKNPDLWFNKMLGVMSNQNIISVVLPVMGYAALMEQSGCNFHLVSLLAKPLKRIGIFCVPLVVMVSFLFNISLVSAATSVLAVGFITIPLMVRIGFHPLVAACAVLIGAWGAFLSPGSQHAAIVAQISGVSVTEVIHSHLYPALLSVIVMSFVLLLQSRFCKLDMEDIDSQLNTPYSPIEKINYLMAVLPLLPIPLLLIVKLPIFETMISCAAIAMLVCWKVGSRKLSNMFFDGIGKAYGSVFGIIIAAMVFIACFDAVVDLKSTLNSLEAKSWSSKRSQCLGRCSLRLSLGQAMRLFNLLIWRLPPMPMNLALCP